MTNTKLGRVAAAVGAGALIGVAGLMSPAMAHVTVDPDQAEQGGYATVVFRAPNERDDASIAKLQVHLPEEHPLTSVRTAPVAGWTVKVGMRELDKPIDSHGSKVDEVVGTLTWTASKGAAVKPGEFLEFPVSMGRLPEADAMVFKTLQTYDDGEVVRWIEEPTDGEEVEHPAPVLRLAKAGASDHQDGASGTEIGNPAGDARADAVESGSVDADPGAPLWLAVAGLVAGLAGLVLGGLAFGRASRRSSAAG